VSEKAAKRQNIKKHGGMTVRVWGAEAKGCIEGEKIELVE
jgi:hypothetical protein